jgi:hypothetical protein
VFVHGREWEFALFGQCLAVEAAAQDRLDALVAAGAQAQGALGGRLEGFGAAALGKAQDA